MVERVETLPEGKPRIFGEDRKRPEVLRVVWTGNGQTPAGQVPAGVLELSFSEPMRAGSLAKARITLSGQEIAAEHVQLSENGRRVLVAASPVAGQQMTLRVEGLEDRSGNLMQPLEVTFTVAESGQYQVLLDAASPQVLAVLDEGEGLSVLFDEPVVPAAGMELESAITVTRAGAPVAGSVTRISPWQLAWRPSESSAWLLGGEYRLSIAGLVELGPEQKPVSTNLVPVTFTHLASGSEKHIVASVPPETPPRASSAFGNTTLFQGRLWVPELGLYYYRARWYDPQLVNFIERDPAGYADSPNLMQAFGLNPVSNRDPWGRWIIPSYAGPAWSENDPDSIPNIARKLLRHPLSLEYLRYRFGEPAKKGTLASMAGLSVEAELENAIKPGSGPAVVFNTAMLGPKPSVVGKFNAAWDTIILPTAYKDAEISFLGRNGLTKLTKAIRGIRVLIANVLAHETIHYLSSRFAREAFKEIPCSSRRPHLSPYLTNEQRLKECWSLHDDWTPKDNRTAIPDIGKRWEILIWGDQGYGLPREVPKDFRSKAQTRLENVDDRFYELLLNQISGQELERRRNLIRRIYRQGAEILESDFLFEPYVVEWITDELVEVHP
jgi:RHS repeat-associated protein